MDDAEREVNEEMVGFMASAIELTGGGCVCPFCGMWWDNKEAERILLERHGEGYREWLEETLRLPVNKTGEDYGHRGPPITLDGG